MDKPDTNFLSGIAKPGPYKTSLTLPQELAFHLENILLAVVALSCMYIGHLAPLQLGPLWGHEESLSSRNLSSPSLGKAGISLPAFQLGSSNPGSFIQEHIHSNKIFFPIAC